LATASAQVCVPLGHSSLILYFGQTNSKSSFKLKFSLMLKRTKSPTVNYLLQFLFSSLMISICCCRITTFQYR